MRECVNCKYSRGLGSDVWCGHNPRGKESYMCETDCIYFEKMTEKRDKVNAEDIIGLIETDEPIDAVEEVRKLRGRESKVKKRFELKSIHFQKLSVVLYDNVKKSELSLSIYELVNLLNEISQPEYSLLNLRDDIYKKINAMISDD